jgi:hypothetical protein
MASSEIGDWLMTGARTALRVDDTVQEMAAAAAEAAAVVTAAAEEEADDMERMFQRGHVQCLSPTTCRSASSEGPPPRFEAAAGDVANRLNHAMRSCTVGLPFMPAARVVFMVMMLGAWPCAS